LIGDCWSGAANNGGYAVEALGFDGDCMEEQRVVVCSRAAKDCGGCE